MTCDNCEELDPLSAGEGFTYYYCFVERGCRLRPQRKLLERRLNEIFDLLDKYFPPEVAAVFGGVYWGCGTEVKAFCSGADSMMYFNARAARSKSELFTDICHEWTHHKSTDESGEHNGDFLHLYETELARFLSRTLLPR